MDPVSRTVSRIASITYQKRAPEKNGVVLWRRFLERFMCINASYTYSCRPPTVVWHAVHSTFAVITDPSAGCPPVTVCNCWRLSLRHCWCSVVGGTVCQQTLSRVTHFHSSAENLTHFYLDSLILIFCFSFSSWSLLFLLRPREKISMLCNVMFTRKLAAVCGLYRTIWWACTCVKRGGIRGWRTRRSVTKSPRSGWVTKAGTRSGLRTLSCATRRVPTFMTSLSKTGCWRLRPTVISGTSQSK